MENKKILIVGGGIAGPALAVQLTKLGADVKVIEARKENEMNEGLFMGISPNGLNILKDLIDVNQIHEEYAPGTLHFFNSKGKRIAELDTAYQREEYGMKSLQLKRSAISKLLHNQLKKLNCTIDYDSKLKSVDLSGRSASVETTKRLYQGFDILIGADGIYSACRNLLFPGHPKPVYTKLLSTGAIVNIPNWKDDSNAMNMIFGERAFFAYATSNTGDVWWFNNLHLEKAPGRQTLNNELKHEIKNQMLELHENDHNLISEILQATDDFFVYPIYDMPPLDKWYGQNFCLIGDAAHAISPHTGQGASLALEDAAVLAKCLEKYPEPENAFAIFQSLRQQRVRKIISQARKVGQIKKKPNPIANFFRDIFLKKFIHMEKKKMDWVYSYDINRITV